MSERDFKREARIHAEMMYSPESKFSFGRKVAGAADYEIGARFGYSEGKAENRNFKLLCREYFNLQAKLSREKMEGVEMNAKEYDRYQELHREIIKELARFTKEELEQLPFGE